MRIFVALDLPEDLRASLAALADRVPVGRRVPAENLHLTLAFLGEVDGVGVQSAHEALAALTPKPAFIRVDGFDLLVGRAGGVLCLRAPGSEVLHGQVMRALRAAGLALERRRYRPHVSLVRLPGRSGGRSGGPVREQLDGFLAQHAALRLPETRATSFGLYRSELHPDGARYACLSDYPLPER